MVLFALALAVSRGGALVLGCYVAVLADDAGGVVGGDHAAGDSVAYSVDQLPIYTVALAVDQSEVGLVAGPAGQHSTQTNDGVNAPVNGSANIIDHCTFEAETFSTFEVISFSAAEAFAGRAAIAPHHSVEQIAPLSHAEGLRVDQRKYKIGIALYAATDSAFTAVVKPKIGQTLVGGAKLSCGDSNRVKVGHALETAQGVALLAIVKTE